MKILMVCLGNICRSPMAHGLLAYKAAQHGLRWEIDSAGLSNWHEGEPPHENSIAVMQKHGMDISNQRSRPFSYDDFYRFDLIYVMDTDNYLEVCAKAHDEEQVAQVKLILEEVFPGQHCSVPDPYGRGAENYEEVYELLERACDKIIARYAHSSPR